MKSKHTSELTADDLKKHPAWKAGVEDDWDWETTDPLGQVLPHPVAGPIDLGGEDHEFVVACEFTRPNGSTLFGYLTCDRSGDLGFIQPTVLTEHGQVSFWLGSFPPPDDEVSRVYKILGAPEDIFPLKFKSLVPIVGGPIAGVIDEFIRI